MSSVLVNPTGTSTVTQVSLAPRRFHDLNGKTVGLLDSTKYNSDRLLEAIGELLQARYSVKEFVRRRKPAFARPVPHDLAAEMAASCDVVIAAVGD